MTESGHPVDSAVDPSPRAAIPVPWVIGIGTGIAAVLALAVSAQTYLSMLGHGHSFRRILVWQLGDWSFWGLAAPFVLRRGAVHAARNRRRWADWLRLLMTGAALIAIHTVLSTQLTLWSQPFTPMVSYDFRSVVISQLPSRFAIDFVVYGLLIVGGGAVAAHHRARRLELRESRLEAELARAQLRALRLEIEPHFLFNTLNAIAALIRLKDNGRALEMLVGLSDFMRRNLDDIRDQFVPLSTEIEWVTRYVSLQQTRFGERLEVEYQIRDDCLDVAVPTLLLQPIVENAIRHGAARQSHRCRIVIGATREQHRLTVWVADDGAGLPADFDARGATGTGLRNTRSRLEQIYGNAASFDMRRGAPSGTTAVIVLPVSAADWPGKATA
jgi:glucose-6-phosphate-specific signal transduction histidine kinase